MKNKIKSLEDIKKSIYDLTIIIEEVVGELSDVFDDLYKQVDELEDVILDLENEDD
ncbi:MAG: hypothetical protein M0P94_04500 [Candidatus Absconditabacterales bacterium]|nr:hypothetical protein [Candidatus Absconditabacterales bacterium]